MGAEFLKTFRQHMETECPYIGDLTVKWPTLHSFQKISFESKAIPATILYRCIGGVSNHGSTLGKGRYQILQVGSPPIQNQIQKMGQGLLLTGDPHVVVVPFCLSVCAPFHPYNSNRNRTVGSKILTVNLARLRR